MVCIIVALQKKKKKAFKEKVRAKDLETKEFCSGQQSSSITTVLYNCEWLFDIGLLTPWLLAIYMVSRNTFM